MHLDDLFTPPQPPTTSTPKHPAPKDELILVVGFAVRDEDQARALLVGASIQFALFRPASYIVFPPTPYLVVVHLRDALTAQALLAKRVLGVGHDLVSPDYFDWHAEPSDMALSKLEFALRTFIAAHTADLKRPNCRGDILRRLNARIGRLPGVVPNENFFGDIYRFAFPDKYSDVDDFAIHIWHENGGFGGRAFTYGGDSQVEELSGNGDALAKWLLDNLPAAPGNSEVGQ